MGKDMRLVNIYLKIHNKWALTLDDLAYLAEYEPECFKKTCQNVVYNIPEAKPIMEPADSKTSNDRQAHNKQEYHKQEYHKQAQEQKPSERQNIEMILDNLKRMEKDEFPMVDIDADKVKNLLGSLYMEMLFPHDDTESFMIMLEDEETSTFDKKA